HRLAILVKVATATLEVLPRPDKLVSGGPRRSIRRRPFERALERKRFLHLRMRDSAARDEVHQPELRQRLAPEQRVAAAHGGCYRQLCMPQAALALTRVETQDLGEAEVDPRLERVVAFGLDESRLAERERLRPTLRK